MYGQNYAQPPGFGFTASAMGGLPTDLNNVNPQFYNQIADFVVRNGGRLSSITGVEMYDTLRVDTGTLPLRDFVFFQNALGQQQGLLVAGTQYTKQEIDVSPWIVGGGQLAKGYEALIWNIGVQFHIVGANDSTLQTAGNPINLTNAIGTVTAEAAGEVVKMGNTLRAFQEGTYFQLFVNQTGFEDGPGWRFPSGIYGGSGYASLSSANATATIPIGDGYINNGFGWAYQMPVMRHIPELTKFGVRMKIQNNFVTPTGSAIRVVVTLGGIGIQPITG
jgi:hypothetical protein